MITGCLKERNLWAMAGLMLITFGIYQIYWLVKTKDELNCLGAKIPTALIMLIPFAYFYFIYKYAQGLVETVKKDSDPVLYFVLLALLPFFGILILQTTYNTEIKKLS